MIGCPGCGGNLKFDIESGMMKCGYCEGQYDPYDFDSKEKDAEEVNSFEATLYICPQCGGELLTTSEVEATSFCSFCGSATIMYQRLKNEVRPDKIIPFKITKEDCKNAYMARLKKSLYASDALKKKECIDSFRGIYMPYWSYNINENGRVSFIGSTNQKRKGDYIYTDYYDLSGNVEAGHKGVDFDASSSFADNISEKILPFNHEDLKDFTPAFLSGFYADTADVDSKEYEEDAISFCRELTSEKVFNEDAYRKYTIEGRDKVRDSFPAKIESVERTMYPVWFMSYKNNDRVAYATVNGQTGKVTADIPVDPVKYFIGSGITAAIIFIILELMVTVTPSRLLTIALICTIIIWLVTYQSNLLFTSKGLLDNDKGMKSVKEKKEREKAKNLNKSNAKKVSQAKTKQTNQSNAKPSSQSNANEANKDKVPVNWKKILSIVLFGIGALVRIINDPNDWINYGMCIVLFISYCTMFYDTIINYNITATRPLPQFAKKGGDDNA